jgi:hypothetical protein
MDPLISNLRQIKKVPLSIFHQYQRMSHIWNYTKNRRREYSPEEEAKKAQSAQSPNRPFEQPQHLTHPIPRLIIILQLSHTIHYPGQMLDTFSRSILMLTSHPQKCISANNKNDSWLLKIVKKNTTTFAIFEVMFYWNISNTMNQRATFFALTNPVYRYILCKSMRFRLY